LRPDGIPLWRFDMKEKFKSPTVSMELPVGGCPLIINEN
jgi:hypothetical protein